MGWGTFRVVWDGSGEPPRGPGRVGGHSGRSVTGHGTLPGVLDGSGDPRGGPRWVGVSTKRSGTGRGTLRMSGT